MKKFTKKPLAAAIGTAVVSAFSLSNASAETNPFGMDELSDGYMQLAEADAAKSGEMKCGAKMKKTQGVCGEGKCGEGKCGAMMKGKDGKCGAMMKGKDGKCGAMMKGKDGKCGAMMKGKDGKCGAMMKGKDGKCGAKMKGKDGKCGAMMKKGKKAIEGAPKRFRNITE